MFGSCIYISAGNFSFWVKGLSLCSGLKFRPQILVLVAEQRMCFHNLGLVFTCRIIKGMP